jgi:hypothetical protein
MITENFHRQRQIAMAFPIQFKLLPSLLLVIQIGWYPFNSKFQSKRFTHWEWAYLQSLNPDGIL